MADFKQTNIDNQGFVELPRGATNQRPANPEAGMLRFNTDFGTSEFYDGSRWVNTNSLFPNGLGLDQSNPAPDAVSILDAGHSFGDGEYWIRVNGESRLVYCDMSNGGWMYLLPPDSATNTNAMNYTYQQTASQTNCASDTISVYDNFRFLRGYRCGSSTLRLTFRWGNSLGIRNVRFAAVMNGGNTYSLELNGSTIGPDYTSSSGYVRYWTSALSIPSTCDSNTCYQSNSTISQTPPRNFDIQGENLAIEMYLCCGAQPNSSWGVAYILGNLAVK